MRYVQLRAFHSVALHGGFSKAAAALHLTQPAISDQIKKLESEYDVRLFDRRKKQVVLTDKGHSLLAITHRMFDFEQQAWEFLDSVRSSASGTLRVVADSTHHIAETLAKFQKEFPGVFISIKSGNSEQVSELLANYDADIGVLGNIPDEANHKIIKLSSTPIIAFAHKDSIFARNKSVNFKTFATWPLVLREQGSKTRAKLEELALERGFPLQVNIEAEGREAVNQIVVDGGGVGIVSEAEFGNHKDLRKILLRDSNLIMEESVICLKERQDKPLISRFMSLAAEKN